MTGDVWMIGRVDQFALLAAHLAGQGRLARWDSFWRYSAPDENPCTLLSRPSRRVDASLAAIPGRHIMPDLLGKSARLLRLPAHNLASDLPLSWLAARHMPPGVRLLHGQGNYSLPALQKAHRHKIPTINDVTGQLAPIRAKQLAAEYQAHGQKWREISGFLARRRIAEARFASAVFAPSDTVAEGLLDCGIKENRIHIIPFDAPLARQCLLLQRPPKTENPLRLLYIGELSLAKGISALLQVFKALRAQYGDAITLTLIGKARTCAASLTATLPEGVIWHGPIPASDIPKALNAADIFVFPSLSEGSSLAVQEAMAASLPVITTHDAGSAITDGQNGLIIPPRDTGALCAAINRLMHDTALRDTLGMVARATIARQLTEGYGNRVCTAYDRVLSAHG
ncbi:glycosyltransferase family 4 protein [Thalassospira sp. TSL5-1]|uniref:glycosyltransferase family 4 protein n=1 Tax=Thalassospira sp. TSL5-1 TaxID=1544451 RepID=UPI000938ED93|nr:glycosyltransferase family 4 protein [Thalassospira sp. TSL5-1]OKH89069.1 glycosyl transferase [Thalassospira sp. TSL5-1]